jgi:hypothetical protein
VCTGGWGLASTNVRPTFGHAGSVTGNYVAKRTSKINLTRSTF